MHPPLPDKKSSSTYPDLKFVCLTSQLPHSLVEQTFLRKILDPLLPLSGRLLGRLLSLIVSCLPGNNNK